MKYQNVHVFLVSFLGIVIVICTDNVTDINEDSEEINELIERMLNLRRPKRAARNKRAVDVRKYQQMGWKLSPDEAKHVFEAYYKCIEGQKASEKTNMVIQAILALEGQRVEMKCKTACMRPDQDYRSLRIHWQRMRALDSSMGFVDESSTVKITDDLTLVLKGVDVTDAGQYYCIRADSEEYLHIYQLDVLFRERRRSLKETDEKKVLPAYNLTKNNLMTYTLWSEWSDCNQCGKVGRRRKVGLCMVKKINASAFVWPRDMPIMEMYPRGVPCRSTILSEEIAKIKRIKYRRSETIMGNCFVPCPTVPPYITITDRSGKVVEVVKAGFYSLRQKPTLPPMVIRRAMYVEAGKNVVLECPSKSKALSLVRWQNNTVTINPMTIRRQTRGRVRTDSINRLHIRGLRLSDTAPYNCWIKRTHVATIKLIVNNGFNRNMKDYITFCGLVLTIVSVSLTCCCVCFGNKSKLSR